MSVILAGLSALFYGVADFAGGFASRKSALSSVLAFSQFSGALLALVFILATGQALPSTRDLAFSFAAGLAGLVGLFTLYRGISKSIVAIVSPLAALVSAAVPVAFGLIRGERPSSLALAGAALCLPAIFLLSWQKSGSADAMKLKSAVAHGLIAGLGFGFFFIAISLTDSNSGLWPVFCARLLSLALVVGSLLVSRQKLSLARESLPWTIGAGIADMSANIFFLLASRSGLLSLVSVVSSLFPAPTVILARVLLRESIPPIRVAGLVLAIAGVALMSLR